jgi:hypothetical protein
MNLRPAHCRDAPLVPNQDAHDHTTDPPSPSLNPPTHSNLSERFCSLLSPVHPLLLVTKHNYHATPHPHPPPSPNPLTWMILQPAVCSASTSCLRARASWAACAARLMSLRGNDQFRIVTGPAGRAGGGDGGGGGQGFCVCDACWLELAGHRAPGRLCSAGGGEDTGSAFLHVQCVLTGTCR